MISSLSSLLTVGSTSISTIATLILQAVDRVQLFVLMRPSLRVTAQIATRTQLDAAKQASHSSPSSTTTTDKPTKFTSSRFRNKPPPPSLDHFIQRGRALALYRTILRSLFRIPAGPARAEPVAYARGEFQRNKNVTDISQIRYLISTGKTEFEGMQRYVDELASRARSAG